MNPNYGFSVERKGDPVGPWVVTKLVDLHRSGPSPEFEKKFKAIEDISNALVSCYRTTEPLVSMVQQPAFRVIRCRRVTQGGEDLVQVDFDYPNPSDKANPVRGGTLVLDPERFWCWRSIEARAQSGQSPGTIKAKVVELRDTAGSFPVPKLIVADIEYRTQEGIVKQAHRHEYDLDELTRLPADNEFSLTAFGLPELKGVRWPESSVPLYFWVSLAAILCLALACGLRILRNRAARAAAAG